MQYYSYQQRAHIELRFASPLSDKFLHLYQYEAIHRSFCGPGPDVPDESSSVPEGRLQYVQQPRGAVRVQGRRHDLSGDPQANPLPRGHLLRRQPAALVREDLHATVPEIGKHSLHCLNLNNPIISRH